MRYYLIAGEASGDLHGGLLIEQLQQQDAQMQYRFWGGEYMAALGGEQVMHYNKTAYMGFWEVITHLKTIRNNLSLCYHDILDYRPDVLILIDYPGFNLRMAKWVKHHKIPVFYYISPKVWAWKSSRVKSIKKYVDAMFCILPFEKKFYAHYDYPVYYIGNPIVDKIQTEKDMLTDRQVFYKRNNLKDQPIIALLPGSRQQEIEKCLPDMLQAALPFSKEGIFQLVVAGLSALPDELYRMAVSQGISVVKDQQYALVHWASAAVVVSGTAVLETALLDTPQVAIYKISPLSFLLKPLLKVDFFTLPNLILEEEVVRELLQHKLRQGIRLELNKLLFDEGYRHNQYNKYQVLKKLLGAPGAPHRAAKMMVQRLKNSG